MCIKAIKAIIVAYMIIIINIIYIPYYAIPNEGANTFSYVKCPLSSSFPCTGIMCSATICMNLYGVCMPACKYIY